MKTGAKIVSHTRYVTFQMAKVGVPCAVFANILGRIDQPRPELTVAGARAFSFVQGGDGSRVSRTRPASHYPTTQQQMPPSIHGIRLGARLLPAGFLHFGPTWITINLSESLTWGIPLHQTVGVVPGTAMTPEVDIRCAASATRASWLGTRTGSSRPYERSRSS